MAADDELDLLAEELADFAEPAGESVGSPLEDRVVAGFEEVQLWVTSQGREPENLTGRDAFERLYAVRLRRIREQPDLRSIVAPLDRTGLAAVALEVDGGGEDLSDDELAAELDGIGSVASDLLNLRHVRSRKEIEAAEEIASRTPCADFDAIRPLFDAVQADLKAGRRQSLPFNKDIGNNTDARIRVGDFYIVARSRMLLRWGNSISRRKARPRQSCAWSTVMERRATS
jgi:hypothetical protein